MDISVIVVQRERFSSVIESLSSLFLTIDSSVNVVVVEGASPENVREELSSLQKSRPFKLISKEYFITPNEARNIGLKNANSEYIVFTDNDIIYEKDWLEYLYKNAEQYKSDFVAPLICIGPPAAKKIHHAGGELVIAPNVNSGRFIVSERHRLMNQPIDTVKTNKLSINTNIVEFHCFLARKSSIESIGGFNEILITREQIDLGLRNQILGNRVTFESKAVVTYMAYRSTLMEDLPYHIFRWSQPLAEKSLHYFQKTWQVDINVDRVLNSWIRGHRYRAISTAYGIKEVNRDTINMFMEIDKKYTRLALETRPYDLIPKTLPVLNSELTQNFFASRPQQELKIYGQIACKRSIRVAGLATMPSRIGSLKRMLPTILNQVDLLYLFLDRFPSLPDIQHEKIIVLRSQDFGDLRANGKLLGMLFCSANCHYYAIDDDILYPPDYCNKLSEQLKLNPNIAIGVHGTQFKNSFHINNYNSDRHIIHRTYNLDRLIEVDIASTDTICLSTSTSRIDVRKWSKVNRVDLCLNIELESLGIKRVLISRKAGWIREIESCQPDSIYRALLHDCSEQTLMANAFLQDRNGVTNNKSLELIRKSIHNI